MPASFRLVYPRSVLESFKRVVERAVALGLQDEVSEMAERIDSGLRTNPQEFGDPIYDRPSLHMHHRSISPLHITYAIHATEPVVFVQTLKGIGALGD